MPNAQHRRDFEERQKLRNLRKALRRALEKEWVTCPRCKNVNLHPDVTGTTPDGGTMIWWMCPNFSTCTFPLDMPAEIYQQVQTPLQASEGFFPLPRIKALAEQYRYLYPITFQSRNDTRCTSVVSVKTSTCDSGVSNSSNERSDCVSEPGTSGGSSVGANRLRSLSVSVQPEIVQDNGSVTDAPSTSGQYEATSGAASEPGESDLEEEEDNEDTSPTTKKPKRVVKRNHAPNQWMKLIEDIAKDKDAFNHMLSLGLPVLVERLRHVISDDPLMQSQSSFTRKTRYTFQVDKEDISLKHFPLSVDWTEARKRLTEMSSSYDNTLALKHASGEGLLDMVGVDAKNAKIKKDEAEQKREERSVQLKQMIEQALVKLSRENTDAAENEVKRRRIEQEDAYQEGRKKSMTMKAKMSAKARVMSILKDKIQSEPSFNKLQQQTSVSTHPAPVLPSHENFTNFANSVVPTTTTSSMQQPWIPAPQESQMEPDPFGEFRFDADDMWMGDFAGQNQNPTTSYSDSGVAPVEAANEAPAGENQDHSEGFDFHNDDMFAGIADNGGNGEEFHQEDALFDHFDNIDTSEFGNNESHDFLNDHFGF